MKRIIIIIIYIILLLAIGWFAYFLTRPEETCQDNIKNQNEEDVDCGGVCAPCEKIIVSPLVLGEKGIVPGGVAGEYDFYGQLQNPNNTFGSNDFQYEITLKDSAGETVASRTGKSFIFPGEKKYIIETNIPSGKVPASAELAFTETKWMEFKEFEKPELEIVNKNYNIITSGVGYSEAKGLLKNKSPFDFNLVKIRIILRNSSGRIIATNSTQMGTVKSGEERDFRAFWPTRFSEAEDVKDMETQIEVNAFDSDAFFRRYFPTQKF